MRRSTGDLEGFKKSSSNTNINDNYRTISTKGSSTKGFAKNFPSNWNARIGLPISTYNEKVFPKYKILFEHL